MNDDDDLRRQLAALQAENERLRERDKQLAQQVLNLEAQIAELQQRLAQIPEMRGVSVELLGAAVVRALTQADATLAKQPGMVTYTIATLDCDVKGFLGAAGSSLTVRPAHPLDNQAAESMSVVRFSVSKIPADVGSSP